MAPLQSQQKICKFLQKELCSYMGKQCSQLDDPEGQGYCERLTLEIIARRRQKGEIKIEESREKLKKLRFADESKVDEELDQFLKEKTGKTSTQPTH